MVRPQSKECERGPSCIQFPRSQDNSLIERDRKTYPMKNGISRKDNTKRLSPKQSWPVRIRLTERLSPSLKPPKVTIGLPWTQVDQTTYETDLTPLSDEASAKLVTAYRLDDHVVKELSKRQLIITSEGEQIGILAVGNDLMVLLNVTNDQKIEHEFAIKFWIVAENITKEVSEILHVEIPTSLNSISCRKLHKNLKEYKEFDKLLKV